LQVVGRVEVGARESRWSYRLSVCHKLPCASVRLLEALIGCRRLPKWNFIPSHCTRRRSGKLQTLSSIDISPSGNNDELSTNFAGCLGDAAGVHPVHMSDWSLAAIAGDGKAPCALMAAPIRRRDQTRPSRPSLVCHL